MKPQSPDDLKEYVERRIRHALERKAERDLAKIVRDERRHDFVPLAKFLATYLAVAAVVALVAIVGWYFWRR